jgi:hypothetical protein
VAVAAVGGYAYNVYVGGYLVCMVCGWVFVNSHHLPLCPAPSTHHFPSALHLPPHFSPLPCTFHPPSPLPLETPLLALGAPRSSAWGSVLALGADKQLHKLNLPSDASAWAGRGGRPCRSLLKVGLGRAAQPAIPADDAC